MKKALYIMFAVLFLVSTTGVEIHAHYCHDQLKELSILKNESSCCDNHCTDCKDESIVVLLKADYVPVLHNTSLNSDIPFIAVLHYNIPDNTRRCRVTFSFIQNKPPPVLKCPQAFLQTFRC